MGGNARGGGRERGQNPLYTMYRKLSKVRPFDARCPPLFNTSSSCACWGRCDGCDGVGGFVVRLFSGAPLGGASELERYVRLSSERQLCALPLPEAEKGRLLSL